ncbi:hypothetical protein [Novosphingobium colocasiae]|uniref:hypothetical protein n=1 Tax=Novosphingobium colocasiae TaxID=1256513 RepID=UPI0035B2B5E0
MTTRYAKQQVGVADGTAIPVKKADGREVNAKRSAILASKVTGVGWASGDVIFLGTKKAGDKVVDVKLTTGTSLGSSTVSVGTLAVPDKYAATKTLTTVDTPTSLGPPASTLDADAPIAEEDLYATIGSATIASGTRLTFEICLVGL